LNNGIVNSQLSSNKLFSIDSLSYSDKVTLRQLHTHRILCSCAYIKSILFLFFLSSRFFFGSSFNHLSIIIIVRSFVQSISTLGRLNCMLKSCTTIAHAFTIENNPLCLHEYDVTQHTTRVMKHYWLSFSISVIRKKSYVIREIN
jgi:hypothetical protein